jgi:hypothetical protein
MGCKRVKQIEYVERPKTTERTIFGTIKPTNGPENAIKMRYYNSLQHKSFYKQRK